ncbi:MAG: hypothetical protein ACTSPI_02805 [Candidatus Heimdallarchaeaceae archaeon]
MRKNQTTWDLLNPKLMKKMRSTNQDKIGFAFARREKRDNTTYIQKWMKDGILKLEVLPQAAREILSLPADLGRFVLDPRNKRIQRQSLIGKTASEARKADDALTKYLELATEQSKFVISKVSHPIKSIKERIGDENVKGITNLLNLKSHKKMSIVRTRRTIGQMVRGSKR